MINTIHTFTIHLFLHCITLSDIFFFSPALSFATPFHQTTSRFPTVNHTLSHLFTLFFTPVLFITGHTPFQTSSSHTSDTLSSLTTLCYTFSKLITPGYIPSHLVMPYHTCSFVCHTFPYHILHFSIHNQTMLSLSTLTILCHTYSYLPPPSLT